MTEYRNYTNAELWDEYDELCLDLKKSNDELLEIDNCIDSYKSKIDHVWEVEFKKIIENLNTKTYIDLNDMNAKKEFTTLLLRDPYYKKLALYKQNNINEIKELNRRINILERLLNIT
jgi:hypothetical protein